MTPTDSLRAKLRKLLNEKIPQDGTDADTNFTNEEIDELLTNASNVNAAAAQGWTEKAALLSSQIESYKVGQEQYDMTSLKDQLNHALSMVKTFSETAKTSVGSMILTVARPEVV